jgi:hypothetical protein
MVKFQKVLLIGGCVLSVLDAIINIAVGKYDVAWQFISASLFFTSYLNLITIDELENKNN